MDDSDEIRSDAFEAMLESLQAGCVNPDHGLFGPESWTWRVGREFVNFMGAGRAALLQMAHPWVATAIAQHSNAAHDISGRFRRTFVALYGMMFGSLETSVDAARRVHRLHGGIRGRLDVDAGAWTAGASYAANVEEALMWVHATLIDTSFVVYERCVMERSWDERCAHYQESRRFGRLFGLTDRVMPTDYAGFLRYWETMLASGTLAVTPAAMAMAPQLLAPTGGAMAPMWEVHKAITSSLLPSVVREGYRLTLGRRERALAGVAMSGMRRVVHTLPPRLRYVSAWHDAQRRIAGKPGQDRVSEVVWRRVIATLLGRPAFGRAPGRG